MSDTLHVPLSIDTSLRRFGKTSAARKRVWRRSGLWLFLAVAVVYLLGGLWLSLGQDSLMSDALSRTANGYYPLFSRDPHLAAIGFVWNPLPSLAQIPVLPLTYFWQGFANRGVIAIAQSACFMAGAVYQLRGAVRELGAGSRTAWVLTALFALHPEIAYYGMNGMSEASFLFFLIFAARCLIRWARTDKPGALAGAGLALGAAYLTRYEAVAAGMTATAFVGVVSYYRTRGSAAVRRSAAVANSVVVALPIIVSFCVWAITSLVIIGSPFAQFTSADGNSAQTKLSASGIGSVLHQPGGPLGYMFDQSRLLEPFGVLLIAAAIVVCVRRRDAGFAAGVAVLGGAYAFSVLALLAGQTFGWLRFSITLVPITFFAAAVLLSPSPAGRLAGAGSGRLNALLLRLQAANPVRLRMHVQVRVETNHRAAARDIDGRRLLLFTLVPLCLAAAIPVTASGLLNPRLAREESYFLTGIFAPDRATVEQREALHRYDQDRSLAAWLDAQHLRNGAVLLDAASGFDVVLSARYSHQFAITTDRDFGLLLGDPKAHHVRYLVTRAAGAGQGDAVSLAFPHIDRNPAFRLVHVFANAGDLPTWHVYAVR
ncbi:MAG: hypothetical protein JWN96_3905 [Mycobacterium sp.]|nr:hypothetical protein [Mycobacterium sp.]